MIIDMALVRQRYDDAGYPGIVAFLDFLSDEYRKGTEVLEVICSSVCFVTSPLELTQRERRGLPSYRIGSYQRGILPLEVFATLDLESVEPDEVACLDLVCRDIVNPVNFCPASLAVTIQSRRLRCH